MYDGAIEEAQRMEVKQSALSIPHLQEVELDDDEDDFMDTYLAINLELKVRESQNSRMQRNNVHTSAREISQISRYQSRLSIKSATKNRPLSKKTETNKNNPPVSSRGRSSSRDEIQPTVEDNFDQYSVPNEDLNTGALDRNSIEDSFNQYENMDKFLENNRRQEERRQLAM